jgi:S1-C subfamily serine protease
MASGLAIHIVSGDDKHTQVLMQDRIRVGAGADCDLRLRSSTLPNELATSGALLELTRANGSYHVTDYDRSLNILHNGAPLVPQAEIADGDELELGSPDLSLQFFPVRALPAVVNNRPYDQQVAPFIEQAALESAATMRRDDAKVFLREFTRELVREINLTTKLIALSLVVALIGGLLYIGFAMYKELQFSRRLINDQKAQLAQMQSDVGHTNQQLGEIDRSNKEVIKSMSLVPNLRTAYGNGVCLIYASFIFVEANSNRPLRYPEPQRDADGAVLPEANGAPQLTPEGNGAVAEFEVFGTGFYVGEGYVLTNRHVAQPWLADANVQNLGSSVKGRPRLKKLTAFFPDHTQPMPLRFKQAAQRDDVAVCVLDSKDIPQDIPALPLDKDSVAVAVGKEVVLMGYPTGTDRLLARLEEQEARSIQTRCGSSYESLVNCLSEKKYIQPLTTRGHITDLNERRIVYDASTTNGGSGAPLFGQSGRVIGINFSVFIEDSASNFAVPMRYAITLLQRAGMKLPESLEENRNGNSNSSLNQRAATAIAPSATIR